MSKEIRGLSLRLTIGIAFGVILALVLVTSLVTVSFVSDAADQTSALSKEIKNQRAVLKHQAELDQALEAIQNVNVEVVELSVRLSKATKSISEDDDPALKLRKGRVIYQDSKGQKAVASYIDHLVHALDNAGNLGLTEAEAKAVEPAHDAEAANALAAKEELSVADILSLMLGIRDYARDVGENLSDAPKKFNDNDEDKVLGKKDLLQLLPTEELEMSAEEQAAYDAKVDLINDEFDFAASDFVTDIETIESEMTSANGFRAWIAPAREELLALRTTGLADVEASAKKVAASAAEANKKAESPIPLIWGMVAVLVVVLIADYLWASHNVSQPLRELSGQATRVAEGDLSQTVSCFRHDEVGELAEAFNAMIMEMNEVIHQAQDVSKAVVRSSRILSDSATGVMTEMDRQSDGINDAAHSVEDVQGRSRMIQGHASSASDASTKVLKHSTEGQAVVNETKIEMNRISRTVADSAQIINGLGQASHQIGNIVSAISEIADQTNLLALNAAIEAARAGEHGRGFAVVADEVRKLAENVSRAANEIIDMISSFKHETERAVSSMTEGAQVVQRGVSLADRAEKSLETIMESVQRVSALMMQTEHATQDQVRATSEVKSTLDSLTLASAGAKDSAHRTSDEAAEMQRSVENLKRLLAHFRLGRRSSGTMVRQLLRNQDDQ